MCGIAGMIGADPDRVREVTRRMTAALSHRGPDADGLEVHTFGRGYVGLGHRRLSILDLSPLGRQPMAHPPSGSRMIYNGEVYNFARLRQELVAEGETFRSGSDTEVILAGVVRQGPGYVRRLEGMYALALLDPRGPQLVLARDPAGIKPLYLARIGADLLFASEVRALLASGLVPRTVDRAAVAGLLAYGSVQQPLTLFSGIRMAPPGSWQVVTPGEGDTIWKAAEPVVWWTPPPPEPAASLTDVVGETRCLLDAAVRDHLVSDVPVGVFLSAGLDSAAVAGLAARHSKQVRAFTVGVADQPDFDEAAEAGETARRLGLEHVAVPVPAAAAEAATEEWLTAADQPSLDGLNTFIISKAVRAHGIKVALTGLGADELFGGYQTFREVPTLRRLRRAVGWLPPAARRGLAGVLTARRPAARGKLADLLGGPADVAALALRRRRVMTDRQLAALGVSPIEPGLATEYLPAGDEPPSATDPGWVISVVESRYYQTNVLLRDSDANGMAHGLELRVPFLDQRLLDRIHRLPGVVRFPRSRPPKWLLREAAADVLHPDLLARPKTGFQLPLRRWMAGPLRPRCEAALAALNHSGLVRPVGVAAVWDGFLAAPEGQLWSRALTLVALGDYLARHASAGASAQ